MYLSVWPEDIKLMAFGLRSILCRGESGRRVASSSVLHTSFTLVSAFAELGGTSFHCFGDFRANLLCLLEH